MCIIYMCIYIYIYIFVYMRFQRHNTNINQYTCHATSPTLLHKTQGKPPPQQYRSTMLLPPQRQPSVPHPPCVKTSNKQKKGDNYMGYEHPLTLSTTFHIYIYLSHAPPAMTQIAFDNTHIMQTLQPRQIQTRTIHIHTWRRG